MTNAEKLIVVLLGVAIGFLGWLFVKPLIVQAAAVSWDRPSVGRINPLFILDDVYGDIFIGTSTTQASVFPYASTTALSVSSLTSGRCVQTGTGGILAIAGGACGSGNIISTTSPITAGNLAYYTGVTPTSIGGVATGTLSVGTTGLTLSGTPTLVNGASTLAGTLAIANGGTNATSYTLSNGIIAYDGTRLVNFTGYTLTSSVLTATNASTTALSVNNRTVTGNRYISSTVASSTWAATSTDNRVTAPFSGTLNSTICKTNTGTVNVQYIINGSNVSSMFNASTTAGTVTFTAGNTFTKGQVIEVDFGTPASTPTNASCTADTTITGL